MEKPSPSMGEGWVGVLPLARQNLAREALSTPPFRIFLKLHGSTPIPDPSPIEGEGRFPSIGDRPAPREKPAARSQGHRRFRHYAPSAFALGSRREGAWQGRPHAATLLCLRGGS